jgi:ribosomal protein S18 acetylase RimI-like enzyme
VERLVGEAQRVVGLYRGERQVGFCRAFTDGVAIVYLPDVYIHPEFRGRGLGVELVREMVENSAFTGVNGSSTRPMRTASTSNSGSARRTRR